MAKIQSARILDFGLDPHLFVKVPRPGDSEVFCLSVFLSSLD